jgi:putative sterol carrier protein
MTEENLKKSDNGSLIFEELGFLIKNLFKKFNKSELVLDEIEGWNKIIQFNLNDNLYFYIFNSGLKLEYFEGKADDPDCTLIITPILAMTLFPGEMDIKSFFEGLMSKKIEIQGESSHFMKLTVLLEFFEDDENKELKSEKKDWIVEAPEIHGMRSDLLDQVAKKLKEIDINRNSIVVIRHGVLVYEEYFVE